MVPLLHDQFQHHDRLALAPRGLLLDRSSVRSPSARGDEAKLKFGASDQEDLATREGTSGSGDVIDHEAPAGEVVDLPGALLIAYPCVPISSERIGKADTHIGRRSDDNRVGIDLENTTTEGTAENPDEGTFRCIRRTLYIGIGRQKMCSSPETLVPRRISRSRESDQSAS